MESVHAEVLRRLAAGYGDVYREENVMLTATHTHCGPGGYSHHATYNSNTGGFRPATFAAIVDGTMEAIGRAHADLAPAELSLARGELHDASVNRSRSSFDLEPGRGPRVLPRRDRPADHAAAHRRATAGWSAPSTGSPRTARA